MWGGRQGSTSPERYGRGNSNGANGESPSESQVAAAAALAARMAFANATAAGAGGAPPAPPAGASSYYDYDLYGNAAAAAAQPSSLGGEEEAAILYAQRARELELLHLQQHMQERQAIEAEARSRLLEHAARNQQIQEIHDYERTRMQMELLAEMQQRDQEAARLEDERRRLVEIQAAELGRQANSAANAMLTQREIDAAAAQNLREQQLTEYLATQQQPQQPKYDPRGESPPPQKEEDQFADPDMDIVASPIEKAPTPPPTPKDGVPKTNNPPSKKKESSSAAPTSTATNNSASKKDTPVAAPPKKPSAATATKTKETKSKSSDKSASKKKSATKKESSKKETTKKEKSSKKDSSSKSKESSSSSPSKKAPPKKSSSSSSSAQKKESKPTKTKSKPSSSSEPSAKKEEGKPSSSSTKAAPMETISSSSSAPKIETDKKNQQQQQPTPIESKSSSAPPAAVTSSTTPTATATTTTTTTTKKKRKAPTKSTSSSGGGKGGAKRAKKSPGSTASSTAGRSRTAGGPTLASLIKRKPGVPSMDDIVPAITEVQYENAQALMTEFCKVPFLAEFSRPVSLLHPELVTLYSKIIHHPMDLGHVCRKIRRKEYKNTRAIQLDVWRVFSNCIKFHMHPSNRENAIPSFISISMHLRDFFNSLWREYMMPSDAPPRAPGKGISPIHSSFQKRAEARKERLAQVSTTVLTPKCLGKLSRALESFIDTGGKVDKLDSNAILGDPNQPKGDIGTFITSLRELIAAIAAKNEAGEEYTVLELHRDLKKCYTEDVFEHEILKKMKISQRLDRILGKVLAPIHEVSCRGVNQSSIWGCMAAAIWARESKKKPYWPAVVLGILAPDDQKEDWHQSLTDRNEARLPEKLREDLKIAKRRAEMGLRKQSSDLMSYFLVEFMGSHEFIWVKESDIIESFDPEEDVNIASAAGNITKKRRSAAFNSKQMSNAIEEGRWALEEFELQLNNTCGDRSDDEDEYNDDAGYTYDILCRSDDEADEIDEDDKKANESDIEEKNELLASDGLLDFSIEGRKKAKARAAALKKQNAMLIKKEKEKEKVKQEKAKQTKSKATAAQKEHQAKLEAEKIKKQIEMAEKKQQKELDARRKKRAREHDKALKKLELERKTKKKKKDQSEKKSNPNGIKDKRGRAEAIAKGYLMRKCLKDTSFNGADYQPTTNVEPSGLLGMALAFRAAAGEVPFLDHNGKDFIVNSWDKIDADGPLESSERCKRLQQQIDLVGKEIGKVDAATERRVALTADAEKAQVAAHKRVLDADQRVRDTYAKKKKKAATKKSPEPSAKPEGKENGDVEVNGNAKTPNGDKVVGKANSDLSADKPESKDQPETSVSPADVPKSKDETEPSTTPAEKPESKVDTKASAPPADISQPDKSESKAEPMESAEPAAEPESKDEPSASAIADKKSENKDEPAPMEVDGGTDKLEEQSEPNADVPWHEPESQSETKDETKSDS